MHENCNPNDCPVNARVDGLEKEFNRHRDESRQAHERMDDRIKDLEQGRSVLETKLDNIDAKLDKLMAWREVQDDKPNKFLDKLKDNAALLILAAVLGAALVKLGIGA